MAKVLVIGDTHEPFCLPGYMQFCARTRDRYKCETIVHIGDEVDQHASSYHEHDPNCSSAGDELKIVLPRLAKWYKEFPRARVCIGNHTQLVQRKAKTAGISDYWIKSFSDVYSMPNWSWETEFEIDGVKYIHDPGCGNLSMVAANHRQSVAFGHHHGVSGIAYNANSRDLIFAMGVGCGVDKDARAMAYGKGFTKKPVVSCGVVLDGVPHVEPMPLGTKYPRNKR